MIVSTPESVLQETLQVQGPSYYDSELGGHRESEFFLKIRFSFQIGRTGCQGLLLTENSFKFFRFKSTKSIALTEVFFRL